MPSSAMPLCSTDHRNIMCFVLQLVVANLSASPLPLRNHLVTSHATSCGQRRWEPVYNHRHDRGADCYPERKSGTLLESNHYDRSSMDPVVPNFTNFLSCFFQNNFIPFFIFCHVGVRLIVVYFCPSLFSSVVVRALLLGCYKHSFTRSKVNSLELSERRVLSTFPATVRRRQTMEETFTLFMKQVGKLYP